MKGSNRNPISITGPSYKHPSQPTNFQRCINMYVSYSSTHQTPEIQNAQIEAGRGTATLLRTAGTSFLGTITPILPAANPHSRGAIQIQTGINTYRTFVVMSNYLYELSTDLEAGEITPTPLGQLATNNGNIRFSYNPTQLMIIDYDTDLLTGGGYIFNYVTNTFSKITDTDFLKSTHCVMIDGYFLLNKPGTAQFYSSDLNNGLSYTALNIATAEGAPGQIVGLAQSKGELWIFCTNHVEVWYDNANTPGMPFSKRVGSDIDLGCAAPYSITQVNDAIVWIDSRGFIVMSDYSQFFRNQSSGYILTKLSDEAIDAELASYSTLSDAIGSTYVDNGHIMCEFTFPTAGKTWVFDLSTSCWHEKASAYYPGRTASMTNFYVQNEQFLLATSINDTNVYLVDRDYLDDAGTPIKRIRTTQFQTADFGLIGIDQLEIKCNVGKAPLGISPNIVLQYSNDSGYTWSDQIPRSLGLTGEYNKRIQWNRIGTAQEWVFNFTISDPVDFSIIDGIIIGGAETS